MKNKYPKARVSDMVVSDYQDEVLIYDLRTNRCHSLNKTAFSVWSACNGNRDLDQIARQIKGNPASDYGRKLVILALNDLARLDLIDEADQYGLDSNVSRREIIKDIGKISLIALPLIASISAPKAAIAQSCLPLQAACMNPPDCCSGRCVTTCCSTIGETCGADADCCGNAAGTEVCGNASTCCTSNGFSCSVNSDCCSGNCMSNPFGADICAV